MSIHSSLRGIDTLVGERSVFTRLERIQVLMKAGKFDPEKGKASGLPKVRTRFKTAKKKAEPAAGAAAPAAGAAPAAVAPAAAAGKPDAKKAEAKKPEGKPEAKKPGKK
jgi:small basic protein (TIGR04137 family)